MELIKEEELLHRQVTYKYASSEESLEHRRQMIAAGYTLMNKWGGSGNHYALYRKRMKRADSPFS